MTDIRSLLESTVACASGADWAGYRLRLAQLAEALERNGASQEELVRRQLDILAGAVPEHDAAGCVAELGTLAEAIGDERLALEVHVDTPAPIDLRGLKPPEPIVRILDALQRAPREPLRVILPHEPQPLYDLLRQRGFRYSGRPRDEGGFEVLIQPK